MPFAVQIILKRIGRKCCVPLILGPEANSHFTSILSDYKRPKIKEIYTKLLKNISWIVDARLCLI